MKHLGHYETREACAITGDCNLEILESCEYPIFCGCVPLEETQEDVLAIQEFAISKEGVIQLKKLIPLDILYQYGHDAGSVGALWEQHHKEFGDFIMEFTPKKVLEIGGAHSKLALHCIEKGELSWSIAEPNPTNKDSRISYIESFFDEEMLQDGYDSIVHSHTFEHIYNPHGFLESIARGFASNANNNGGGGGKCSSLCQICKNG